MSATDCIHGVPMEPWPLPCAKCVQEAEVLVELADDDPDYGGAFDGFTVSSDADPGL